MLQYKLTFGPVGVEETQISLSRWACLEMSIHAEEEKSHWYPACVQVETALMYHTSVMIKTVTVNKVWIKLVILNMSQDKAF